MFVCRHSVRPMGTDEFTLSNSIAVYTKPGWQSSTEPGFITSLDHNSIYDDKSQWQFTTESGIVTRVKKPSSNKPKNKPTKKPVPSTTNKYTTKYGMKNTTTKR